jgi:membrane protein YdbS with pleckstrin-like domain
MKVKIYSITALKILLNFTLILFGSFIAINLSTILGQAGDWGMLASGLITALVEIISRVIYKTKRKISLIYKDRKTERIKKFINLFNNVKIGLLYGFFVEAFKLGS